MDSGLLKFSIRVSKRFFEVQASGNTFSNKLEFSLSRVTEFNNFCEKSNKCNMNSKEYDSSAMNSPSITSPKDYANKIPDGLSSKHDHNRDVGRRRPKQPYLRDASGLQDVIRLMIPHLTDRLQLSYLRMC